MATLPKYGYGCAINPQKEPRVPLSIPQGKPPAAGPRNLFRHFAIDEVCRHPRLGLITKTDFTAARREDTGVIYPVGLNDKVTPVD